jgi:predicted N-formylglutamate amidohydrolase
MHEAWTDIAGAPETGLLIIADHASNHVPDGIDLGIALALGATHIALDIGVAALSAALCARLGCPAILGGVSRLVIDLNREADAPGLIPVESDGHVIPGNRDADLAERTARYWRPYHDHIASHIAARRPVLLVSVHSFTPRLATRPDEARPWEVGVLYNEDDRAARTAIPLLEAAGVITGDQLPYSGKTLNATMNCHGEGNRIPYLGLEVRQDLISDGAGVARWADILAPIIQSCRDKRAAHD